MTDSKSDIQKAVGICQEFFKEAVKANGENTALTASCNVNLDLEGNAAGKDAPVSINLSFYYDKRRYIDDKK